MFPVVPYLTPSLSPSGRRRAETLADALRSERPELVVPEIYRSLVPSELPLAPAVHLDDQSAITSPSRSQATYRQGRARCRAEDGDYVVTTSPEDPAYEPYCETMLALGKVCWLTAKAEGNPRRLANHAMRDRDVRRELTRAIRREGLLYVHPYMGSTDVWELARALESATRRPVKVLAPHPELTRWVNDKVHFADVVTRLLGERFVPETHDASSLSVLSDRVRALAQEGTSLVIKLPDSAAGAGNVLVRTVRFRHRSLEEIHAELRDLMETLNWRGESHLLVSAWTDDVQSAPSSQLWIPPLGLGDPVVEGLFEQRLDGLEFTGSQRAELPHVLAQEIADRSALLGLTFQQLGYVGRCSFDLVLARDRIEFIEANGRWGGTSTPMTLMNRVLGRWWDRAHVARALSEPGLARFDFDQVLAIFRDRVYDANTRKGELIFYNPASVRANAVLNVVALAESTPEAGALVETTVRALLRERLERAQR